MFHLLTGLGWFGAVAAFDALAVTALVAQDERIASSCYQAMAVLGLRLVAPLSIGTLAIGLAQAAGTAWGVVRHWWIVTKLGLTLFATAALLVHLQPTFLVAEAARSGRLADLSIAGLRLELVVAPSLALLLLGVNATLGVVKPAGLTPFLQRSIAH